VTLDELTGELDEYDISKKNYHGMEALMSSGTSFNISITASEREGGHGSPTTMI